MSRFQKWFFGAAIVIATIYCSAQIVLIYVALRKLGVL
jgi:hypothetical protein